MMLFVPFISSAQAGFSLIKTLNIEASPEYDKGKVLKEFAQANSKTFKYYETDISDGNYSRVSRVILPGEKFKVEFYRITKESVTYDECMAFLNSKKAALLGAQGLVLLFDQNKDKLPNYNMLLSFDVKESLWEDTGFVPRIPYLKRNKDVYEFDLEFTVHEFSKDEYLVCFVKQ